MVLLAGGALALPGNPLLALLLIIASAGATSLAARALRRLASQRAAISARQDLTFAEELPRPLDAQGRPLVDPVAPRWEAADVAHDKIESSELIRTMNGGEGDATPWYRYTVRNPAAYRAQEAWLASTCPGRYRVVRTWWSRGFLLPALERRFPGTAFRLADDGGGDHRPGRPPASGLDRLLPDRWECEMRARSAAAEQPWRAADLDWCQEVAGDYQYQLFAGVRLALTPARWTRRIDKRPSHRALSFLGNALLDLHQGERPTDPALPERLRVCSWTYRKLYFGHGSEWDVRHLRKYHDTLAQDLASTTGGAQVDGDPRIWAAIADEVRPIFLDEKVLNLHANILGAPGSGKTRFLENILVQAITSGRPLVMVDPKLDRRLLNRVWEIARRAGRASDLHLFHLNAPRCREVSDYNPLYVYNDPAELCARVAAVVEKTRDPFWFRVGMSTAKAVTMLSHYVMQYLCIISAERRDGRWRMGQRYGDVPPRYLLALQWRWDHPGCTPAQARTAVEAFLAHRLDGAWTPGDEGERNLLEMCRLPFYSARAWNPNLKPVNVFGVGRPETLVAWALRVVYLHLWMDERERAERPLNRPDTVDLASVVGTDESSWWQRYQRAREHPLTAYLDDGFRVGAGQGEALAFMREFLPPEAIDGIGRADCVAWNRYVHDALRMMHAKSVEERKEYQKHMATLAASLANFEGERERLLCSEDPDIIIRDAVRSRGIVYFTANYMKDNQASEAACRTFVIDGLSFLGDVYGASSAGRYDWYFCADEVATFITTDLIPFMSQGRGAGVHTILLGQNGIDYQVALGDKAKADQLQGVTRTRITLCTANQQDARDFSEASGKRIIRVRRGFSLNTSRADGNFAAHTIGHYSQSENANWEDKEIERVPPTALLQLPTGQAFVRSTDAIHLVLQGQLPEPRCNILREYGLLSYHDDEEVPPITARHLRELDLTNRRLEEGIFPGRPCHAQGGLAVPSDRLPQDRAADLAVPPATGGAAAAAQAPPPERASAPAPTAGSGAGPATGGGDEGAGDEMVVR
jgi:hypothetical protein